MSIPPNFASSAEYFNDILTFLKNHQWLYNYPNIDILTENILKQVPPDWLDYIYGISTQELNDLAQLKNTSETCPVSMTCLINKIKTFKSSLTTPVFENFKCTFPNNNGLSAKKIHEIMCLAPLIDDVCKRSNCTFIVDVGAGLGYLPSLLNEKFGYKVLALEGDLEKLKLAQKFQEKHYPNSMSDVKFVHCFVTENSASQIVDEIIKHAQTDQKVCITGLHACADLSITILNLFSQIPMAQSMAIMPCCYHRLKVKEIDGKKEVFSNFPVSQMLKDMFVEFEAPCFIKRPFLRLSCQESGTKFSNMSEEMHKRHSVACMLRAIMQLVAQEEGCVVSRLKRKSGKAITASNMEDYLNNLKNTHKLVRIINSEIVTVDSDDFKNKMLTTWNTNKPNCHLVEILTAFQAALQSVCENFILLDRVQFLIEKNIKCYVEKVANEEISPRCYALIAQK